MAPPHVTRGVRPWSAALTLGILLMVSTLATAASAAVAPSDPLAALEDPRGDVRIHESTSGLTAAERKSIDLRAVTVERRGSTTRFTVRMRDIRGTRGWDQMVFVNFATPSSSDENLTGQIGFAPQVAALSFAYLELDNGDYESCDPLRAKVSWRRDLVSLDVPRRCLPDTEVVVRVRTMTGYFRSDAGGPWSSDTARFSSPISLR